MTWAPVSDPRLVRGVPVAPAQRPLLHRLALSSMAVLDGMLSDAPEDDKLAALEQATSSLVGALLKFLGLVVAGGTCIATPCMFVDGLGLGLLATWQGIAAVSVGGTLAFVVPNVLLANRGQSLRSRTTSAVPVAAQDGPGPPPCPRRADAPRDPSVEGLGRNPQPEVYVGHRVGAGRHHEHAGTARDQWAFHSLNYANMPLVLAPGTWRRVHNPASSPKRTQPRRRHHGWQRPAEALEEVFFQTMATESTSKTRVAQRVMPRP